MSDIENEIHNLMSRLFGHDYAAPRNVLVKSFEFPDECEISQLINDLTAFKAEHSQYKIEAYNDVAGYFCVSAYRLETAEEVAARTQQYRGIALAHIENTKLPRHAL